MSLSQPYCTVSDVKRETKSSDSELDATYIEAINFACRWIDSYCGRDFWFHDYLAEGSTYLVPRNRVIGGMAILPFPVVSVTGIWVLDKKSDVPADVYEVDSDDYLWTEDDPIITVEESEFGVEPLKQFLRISGSFGYTLDVADPTGTPPPTVPTAIRRSATLIAAAWSGEMSKDEIGLDGSRVEMMDSRIPLDAMKLLKPFKEVSMYAL
tara:strand:+ start:15295 stop:15924 length:630 start_codon:yes stop_codon:yes gene_type:complete